MGEKTVLEMIAPSVEEAIDLGLEQLGISREEVEIEILDTGSKGIFGIGNRQARIRLMVISPDSKKEEIVSVKSEAVIKKVPEVVETTEEEEYPEVEKEQPKYTPVFDLELALDVTKHVVEELLEKMRVYAQVTTSFEEPADAKSDGTIQVDISGNDLSILIGRQAETLNALQYITSLIVAKELGQWVTILVDVQGYRSRREHQLRKLARRMAEQAVKSGRRQVLEPMPANERRYIHLELRNHPEVTTESIGEDPNRKVTIIPKR